MKVVLVSAMSLDGYITKGQNTNIYDWTSKEDTKYFFNEIEKAELIVMGSKTYGMARHFIKHKEGRLRIVLSRSPQKFASDKVPGFLEFTSKSLSEIVSEYSSKTKEMLVVGGSEINTLFLKENLVNEIWVTIEPLLFGEGKKMSDVFQKLELLSLKKLNSQGTLLLKYKVMY